MKFLKYSLLLITGIVLFNYCTQKEVTPGLASTLEKTRWKFMKASGNFSIMVDNRDYKAESYSFFSTAELYFTNNQSVEIGSLWFDEVGTWQISGNELEIINSSNALYFEIDVTDNFMTLTLDKNRVSKCKGEFSVSPPYTEFEIKNAQIKSGTIIYTFEKI